MPSLRRVFLFLSLASSTLIAQTQSPFTLEQIIAAPYSSELTAAKTGSRVAWVFNLKGVRNVWVADGPDFNLTARQVTHYTEDSGVPIASLRLTPDGKTVVYALGSETNDEKEVANPSSTGKEIKQQVFAQDIDKKNSPPRLLGEMGCGEEDCEDIEISPDSKWALWSARKKLWLASIDGKQQAKELLWIRGDASGPQWSPDGKSVAFVSDRGDHSFVSVFDIGGTQVRYMAPSVDKDVMPRWSPDGKQLVFVRLHGDEQKLPIIPERPNPCSLWIADAATGQGHLVWRSGERMTDSFPDMTDEPPLFWAADRIIFASEQDDRLHLYSVNPLSGGGSDSANRGQATLLTPGDFDVEDVTLTVDKKNLIYTSNQNTGNQDDVDRRHVWQVSVEGGTPQAVSKGETMEWTPKQTGDGKYIVSLGSSASSPAMPYELKPTGRQILAGNLIPQDFPSAQLITPKPVIFKSADGFTIHGQLFMPRNASGKVPGIIFDHGGPERQMMLGYHYMGYYHNAYGMNQYLASQGYAVLSVNYRLGIMYGRAFRHPPNTIWRGAAEYQDVVAGAKYLQSLPEVDADKIGIWGGSYGGFLCAMGLAHDSGIFKVGVDFHGVHDWSIFLTQRPFFGNAATKPPDLDAAVKLAWESSPDSAITGWKSPVLLIHGDDDRNVPFEQTVDLVQRLRAQHVPFEELIIPDEIHGFLRWQSWVRAYKAEAEFFDRVLKKGEKISAEN